MVRRFVESIRYNGGEDPQTMWSVTPDELPNWFNEGVDTFYIRIDESTGYIFVGMTQLKPGDLVTYHGTLRKGHIVVE